MISIIQKLGPHFSFAKWLLCSTGLIRYLYPTNDELRQLANIPKDKSKGKKGNKGLQNGKNISDTFHIERSLDVHLETAKVTHLDVIHLRYFTEYQWLVDFSMYAAVVYVITEVYILLLLCFKGSLFSKIANTFFNSHTHHKLQNVSLHVLLTFKHSC